MDLRAHLRHSSLRLRHSSLRLRHSSLRLRHSSLRLRQSSVRLRHCSLADAATATTFAIVARLALRPTSDPDSFWHLGTGRWIWHNKRVPRHDPFSWTSPGRRWIAHEWLTEAVWYPVHRVGGWTALGLLSALIILFALINVWKTARLLGGGPLVANAVVVLASLASLETWGIRPQMLTFALVALLARWTVAAWLADRDRAVDPNAADRARCRLRWIPALMVPWANAHGGYIFGIVVLGAFALGLTIDRLTARRLGPVREHSLADVSALLVRTTWLTLAATVGATFLNPNGLAGVLYPFTYLGDNASTRYVIEWFAPRLTESKYWAFSLLLALAVLAVARRFRSMPAFALGETLALGVLAVQSVRNITLFAALATPWIVRALTPTRARVRKEIPGAAAVHLVLASVAVLFLGGGGVVQARESAQVTSHRGEFDLAAFADAAAAVTARPDGRLLNEYQDGGYLIWAHPDVPVAVDGRPDMYGDAAIDRYVSLWFTGAGWQAELDRIDATVIVGPVDAPIVKALQGRPETPKHRWRVRYQDPRAVVLERIG